VSKVVTIYYYIGCRYVPIVGTLSLPDHAYPWQDWHFSFSLPANTPLKRDFLSWLFAVCYPTAKYPPIRSNDSCAIYLPPLFFRKGGRVGIEKVV
jgi:hypothetical protein